MSTPEGLLQTRTSAVDTAVHARPDPRHVDESMQAEYRAMAACIKLLRAAVMKPNSGAQQPRITLQQYEAMLTTHIAVEAEGITIGGLARSLGVKHNTVVMLVNRLCKKELMLRIPSDKDHRRVHLRLTAAGKTLLDSLIKADGGQAALAGSHLTGWLRILRQAPPG